MPRAKDSTIQNADHWGLVLAAGDGTRIQEYVEQLKGVRLPKQYVNFLGPQSMLEATFERIERLIAPERILTVVGKHHLEHEEVRRQLAKRKKDNVIVQPANKETGPGILLPLLHILKRSPEAIVSVYPSDHFILEDERFMDHVELAAQAVARLPSRIVLLATEPQSAETEYGYVIPRDDPSEIHLYGTRPVAQFIEKPAKDVADRLILSGALWNTMVLVFKAKTLVEMFERIHPAAFHRFGMIFHAIGTAHEEDTVERVYRNLQPLNFSKDFLENAAIRYPGTIHVLPVLQVFWSDWGSRERILAVRRTLRRKQRIEPRAPIITRKSVRPAHESPHCAGVS